MATVFGSTNIRPKDPHLTIYIHAPGLIVFNKTEKRAECGLLELCNHTYRVSVYKWEGEAVEKIHSSDITWDLTRIGSGDRTQLLDGGPNRYEDFKHIFEMTNLYEDDIVLHRDKEQWRTKFYFKNMVFATAADSVVKAVPVEVGSNKEKNKNDVGRAVMILSRDGETVPSFKLGKDPITLEKRPRYEMVVRHTRCYSTTGDFKHLYDVLAKAEGTKHQLKYLDNPLPWKSPAEKKLAQKFLDLAICIHDGTKKKLKNKERNELASHLRAIAESIVCDGVACLEGTIKDKSLSIP